MTSLSTRSSNAIKLSPGNTQGVISVADEGVECQHLHSPFVFLNSLKDKINNQLAYLYRNPELILIFVSTLCVFFALLSLRMFDNNRLTSWQWVFSDLNLFNFTFLFVFSLLVSVWLSTISIPRSYTVMVLFVLSFFSGMLHWSSPEVIVDAARYFTQAKLLEVNGIAYFFSQWGSGVAAWTDLPLVPFIYGLIFNIFGESRLGIQIINTLFFSGTVVTTYYIGKNLWSHRVGLYGAAMLLGMPYLYTQIPLMMVDVPSMFFLTLAVFLYIKAITKMGFKTAALAASSIALAMLAKYSNWLMLSILPVIFFVFVAGKESKIKRHEMFHQSGLIVVLLSVLICLVMFWKYEIFAEQIALLFTYQLPILGGWTESYVSTFFFQVHPIVSLAALFSLYLAYRKRDCRFLIVAWMLALIVVLDIKRIRYALIAFPMLALMAGYAFSHIEHERIRRYLALSIIVSTCLVSVFGYKTFLEGSSASNIRHAGEYINALNVAEIEVVPLQQLSSSINPMISVPLLDLSTRKPIVLSSDHFVLAEDKPNWIERSTFRFSWEYHLPDYYRAKHDTQNKSMVIILSDPEQKLPDAIRQRLSGFYRDKRFDNQEGIFRYTTIVDIYLPFEMQEKNTTL